MKQKFHSEEKVRIKSNQVAAIHHYWLKSTEEWFIKACWRGRPIVDHAESTKSKTVETTTTPNNNNNNTNSSTNDKATTTTAAKSTTTTTTTKAGLQHSNCNHAMATTRNFGSDVYDNVAWQAMKHYVPEYAALDASWS